MDKKQKAKMMESLLKSCLFSEYLPSEFTTKQLKKDAFTITNNAMIPPITFSMDKFNDYGNRRYISIPDICAFIQAIHSLDEKDILDQILKLNNSDVHSLSKILNVKNEIKKFTKGYGFSYVTNELKASTNEDDDFISNLAIKLEKSSACKCILHLDIANFYNSIYTHNISTLTQGESWANQQFQLSKTGQKPSEEYINLKNIDSKIADLNLRRTHGILIGPRLSFIIAESLLTQIDNDLEKELLPKDIDFVRFVDDYDIFIKDEQLINTVKDVFNIVLQKYGLFLNDSKTKIEYFPFYTYIDYNDFLDKNKGLTINEYAKYAQIEKNNIQNGALLFFCENVLSQYIEENNSDLALSLSFSILKNVSKATISSCKNILKYKSTNSKANIIRDQLISLTNYFVKNKYDLESIWALYILLKKYSDCSIDEKILIDLCEPASVIYLYESLNGFKNQSIIEKAKNSGWLLNYELFFNNLITSDQFKANLKIDNVDSYMKLKSQGVHFYIKNT